MCRHYFSRPEQAPPLGLPRSLSQAIEGRRDPSTRPLVRGPGSPEATLGVRGFHPKEFLKVRETPGDSAEPGTPRAQTKGRASIFHSLRPQAAHCAFLPQ